MTSAGNFPSALPRWRAAVGLALASCVLFAVAACTKGRTDEEPENTTSPTEAAAGVPTYQVSVDKFTYRGMPDSVPSDTPFQIVFANKESFDIIHELVVVQIPNGQTIDDVIADAQANGPDSEDNWLHFGEIGEVGTGATGVGTFYLPPGNYAIACWQEGAAGGGTGPLHLTIGMAKTFTASPSADVPADASNSAMGETYQVSVDKFTYRGMPDSVPSDTPFQIVFANKESFDIIHELVVVQIPNGQTIDDVIADAQANGPDSEDNWLHFGEIGEVGTGATGVGTFYLPPGDYAIACWQEGAAGGGTGPLHLTIGMAKTFTASAS